MKWRYLLAPFIAAALVLTVIGCGSSGTLSLSQYKDQAGKIHNDVGTDLSVIFDEMNTINFEDVSDLQSFANLVSDAVDTMNAGITDLEDLVPPESAQSFHQRLLDFYDNSLITLETLERDTAYSVTALGIFNTLETLTLGNITSGSSLDDILAAAQQDLVTMQAKTAELASTAPPPDLSEFQQQSLANFQQFTSILEAMIPAIQSGDVATLDTLTAQASALETKISNTASLVTDVFDRLGAEIDDMVADGADLQDELETL